MPTRPPIHRAINAPAAYDASRLTSTERGYGGSWRRMRAMVLAEEPLCRFCFAADRLTPATDVDHIRPIVERPDLRLERSNLRALCHACHSRHTAVMTADRPAG